MKLHSFIPLIFFVIFMTICINYGNCQRQLDSKDFTEDKYDELLNEIMDYVDDETSKKYEPKQKSNLHSMDWENSKEQMDKMCPNFYWAKNLTGFIDTVYICKLQFLNRGEWDQMETRELISTYCDDDKSWAGYVDCVLPNLQTYIPAFFQCTLEPEFSQFSRLAGNSAADVVQYTLELIPRVLESARTMQCSNQDFLAYQFEADKELTVINSILSNLLTKQYQGDEMETYRINIKLVTCMKKENHRLGSICKLFSYVDWKAAATECLPLLVDLKSPEVHDAIKELYPLIEFMQDEKQGGVAKREFLDLLWFSFCSIDSPLAPILNHVDSEQDDDEKEKKLKELEQVKAELSLAKEKLRALYGEYEQLANHIHTVQGVLELGKEKRNA